MCMRLNTNKPRWLLRLATGVRLRVAVLFLCAGMGAASAHVMVAQRGTLNLQGEGAFLVVSLPVSAFSDVDDDRDGKLSFVELRAHQKTITEAVQQGIRLQGGDAKMALLQGLMLSLAQPDEATDQAATQLLVMGRFGIANLKAPVALEIDLFGHGADAQTLQIQATRGDEAQWLVFTPEHTHRTLFASAAQTLWDFMQLGTLHILTGWDHLLFLLLVLASKPAWRSALYALSSFTLGHAVTLVVCVFGGLTFSSAWVEPSIVITIVAFGLFELQARRLQRPMGSALRLALVFACALIHGLGLGNSLLETGLDSRYRALSLVGFNVGIELGQIVLALCVLTCLAKGRLNPTQSSQQRSAAQ